MLEYKGYFGTVEADDGVFTGRVSGLRDVITFEGATFAEIEQAFRDSIDDYLAFCAERGEPPDRPYSGKIPLRVSPEMHRRAATLAQAAGMSLNQWIAHRIETGTWIRGSHTESGARHATMSQRDEIASIRRGRAKGES